MLYRKKKPFTRVFVACLLFISLALVLAPEASASKSNSGIPDPPTVSAKSAVLLEAESGRVITGKREHVRMPMASTTKIMTALVAMERVPLDRVVSVSAKAVGVEGSSVYLFAGEELTMEALLYAMLLESANDAAAAIAIEVGGSIDAFADLMNEKAKELGLADTHFKNPHGLGDEDHYTTAYDLAVIAAEALKNVTFRRIVSTYKKTIPMQSTGGVRLLINHNKMLRLYDGAIGVKTGFTKQSGRCLVSAAERDGVMLVAVTLSAPDDWNDHTRLLDYGFSLYERINLTTAGGFRADVSVVGGTLPKVSVTNRASLSVSLPKNHESITTRVELPRFLFGRVEENQPVGRLIFLSDLDGDGVAEEIGSCELVATAASDKAEYPSFFVRLFRSIAEFFRGLLEKSNED